MPTDDSPEPGRRKNDRAAIRAESNPLRRQRAFLSQRYAVLRPAEEARPGESATRGAAGPADESAEGLAPDHRGLTPTLPRGFQKSVMRAYRRRRADDGAAGDEAGFTRGAARPGPANNWVPLGPSVVRQGQAVNRPAVSGRAAGLAVAPGGLRVYVASANGGVWRSDDSGHTWRSTMDAWDLNPTGSVSDSLACGAVALDPSDPERVYVGTGEGGAESYFGVGPIRTDDGGLNWVEEPSEPTLEGSGFYQLALDPAERERVVGATESGLYRREPSASGGPVWLLKMGGVFTSVVSARGADGPTRFYAARDGVGVYESADGDAWRPAGRGFPTTDTHRIALAVQPDNPDLVYALVCRPRESSHLRGVWRLDRADGRWREVRGAPEDLFGDPGEQGQGWYDLAIAVDPHNGNRVYLGGSTKSHGDIYPSSLYSCLVTSSGAGSRLAYRMSVSYIGPDVHSDIHALVFTPGDSNRLWVGCDGGVFYTKNATAPAPVFVSRNVGLATLTMNFMSQHPTEEAVIFCGTQDNGTNRYTGEAAWLHSAWGDGGFVVVNWRDPSHILRTYAEGVMQRAEDGGQSYDSWWQDASLPEKHQSRCLFYAPLVGTPVNPSAPKEADVVAFGGVRLWLSTDFGREWKSLPAGDVSAKDARSPDALRQPADPDAPWHAFRSLAFATARRIYGGTTLGEVYRYDRAGTKWKREALHAAPLPRDAPVTCVAVDAADPSGDSVYVTFGGHGDFRHVWHFDGRGWSARSGPADDEGARLLDVQYNAVVVDPSNPAHLYAGADVGVWRSLDGGRSWEVFSHGLPDAAVLDLQLHAPSRLLRAATHGRGVFEYRLDTDTARMIELYVRDTQLDTGRRPTAAGLPDPTRPGRPVRPGGSPDIRLDPPQPSGNYRTPTNQLDFYQFADLLTDPADEAVTTAPGDGVVNNRVYVQVHNRGLTPADGVKVFLLLARTGSGLPVLPAGFAADVRAGRLVNSSRWRTVGVQQLHDVRAGAPKVAAFDLPSSLLPPPGELAGEGRHCLLALVHAPGDEFEGAERAPAKLAAAERKAAYLDVRVKPFEGVHPGMLELDLEENVSLKVWGMRRGAGGAEYVCVRPADRRGRVLAGGAVRVELSAVGGEGSFGPLRPLKYNRAWQAFWLRAEELPRGPDAALRVVVMLRGRHRRARKTQTVGFDES